MCPSRHEVADETQKARRRCSCFVVWLNIFNFVGQVIEHHKVVCQLVGRESDVFRHLFGQAANVVSKVREEFFYPPPYAKLLSNKTLADGIAE